MTASRVFNFSPGPSALPENVLRRAASEMLNYEGTGMSVTEMSHRSKPVMAMISSAEQLLRELMGIPENYDVIFMQGGATMQFAMVPMNLMTNKKADYVVTGSFAGKALEEARKYGDAAAAASSKDRGFSEIPAQGELKLRADADYVHICENNTIFGSKWSYTPDTGAVPLVSDMSSCILSEPVDVSKYGLIYAGAQKNMAPAGLTVVIVRKDLTGRALPETPVMFDYAVQAKNESLYNTPPVFCIYMLKLVLENLKELGGVAAMAGINRRKAAKLYEFIDSSALFKNKIRPDCRSIMNVTCSTGSEELDAEFCAEAAKSGLTTLKGHRLTGGIRANIYNAMPEEGVDALVAFMEKFEKAQRA